VSQDHYAVLGVSPGSNERQIRSAYLSLIRRYHPDATASVEAGEKARAINTAYVVLRDREKRAQYDRVRGSEALARMPHCDLVQRTPRARRLESLFFASVVGACALALWQYSSQLERSISQMTTQATASQPGMASTYSSDFDFLAEETSTASVEPSIETGRLKQSEIVEFDEPAPLPAPKISDQPPSSTIAATSNETRSNGVAKPLATLRMAEVSSGRERRRVQVERTCNELSTEADTKSCRMDKFAIMDRQLGALVAEAMVRTDATSRARLFESRYRFLDRLASCKTDDCVRLAYIARSQEVTSIAFASNGGPGK
jgi:curved DNA-binding protein CbpA